MLKRLENRDNLSTLVGIILIPVLGVVAHYLTTKNALLPRWDFYLGLLFLMVVSYFISYIYYPKKRLKSFSAGIAASIFISGFIGEFVPTAKKFEYPLVEKLAVLSKLAGKVAAAGQIPESEFREYVVASNEKFVLKLTGLTSKEQIESILNSSNLRFKLYNDRMRTRDSSGKYNWSQYNPEEQSISLSFNVNKDDVGLGLMFKDKDIKNIYLPITHQFGTPVIELRVDSWGDFLWAFGFKRRHTQVYTSMEMVNRNRLQVTERNDQSRNIIGRGFELSEHDSLVVSSDSIIDNGITVASVRAGVGHYLDPKFVDHIKSLNSFVDHIYSMYVFDPLYDMNTQLEMLRIQLSKGLKTGLKTDKIVVALRSSVLGVLARDLDNEGNDRAARIAALGYFKSFNVFIQEIRQQHPNSDVVLSVSPKAFHPFLSLISADDFPNLFEADIWVSDMVLESDDKLEKISMDTYRKFDRYEKRIWHSSSFYIPLSKSENWKDLELKRLVFDIYQ